MNFTRFVALIALFLSLSVADRAAAQDFPALYGVTGVAPGDWLNIRAEPSARSDIIGRFDRTQTGIEVIGRNEAGTWGLVNVGEGTGWASLRYLSREGDSGWTEMTQPFTCFGTEPFWSARFLPGFNRVEVEQAGGPGNAYGIAWHGRVAGRPPYAAGRALTGGGFATFRAGTCSDGMSDSLYGFSVLLYHQPGDGLEGCCTLR